MTRRQMETKQKIEDLSGIFGVDPKWAVAIAMTESSLGERLKSPTGCRGVFQMSTIAMRDLLQRMEEQTPKGILAGIVCGLIYMSILFDRFGSMDAATLHFCDPKDRHFYLDRVKQYMEAQVNATDAS